MTHRHNDSIRTTTPCRIMFRLCLKYYRAWYIRHADCRCSLTHGVPLHQKMGKTTTRMRYNEGTGNYTRSREPGSKSSDPVRDLSLVFQRAVAPLQLHPGSTTITVVDDTATGNRRWRGATDTVIPSHYALAMISRTLWYRHQCAAHENPYKTQS